MAEEQLNNEVSPPEDNGAGQALTSIHDGIHCAATTDTTDSDDELDHIAINLFPDTLGEVAMAIIQRRQQQ